MNPDNQQPVTPEPQAFTPAPVLPSSPLPAPPPSVSVPLPAMLPVSTPSSGKKLLVPVILVAVILLGGAAVAAAVLLGSKKTASPSSSNHSASTYSTTPTPTPKPTLVPLSATTLSQVIKANFGISITLQKLVQHYANKEFDQGDEGILVQSKMESDGSYTAYSGRSQFQIVADGKVVNASSRVKAIDLAAAGYPLMPEITLKKGLSASGYWLYAVPIGTKKVTFRFHQAATKILGGSTVPEKNYDVDLVQ